jgi:hypothetical protein
LRAGAHPPARVDRHSRCEWLVIIGHIEHAGAISVAELEGAQCLGRILFGTDITNQFAENVDAALAGDGRPDVKVSDFRVQEGLRSNE